MSHLLTYLHTYMCAHTVSEADLAWALVNEKGPSLKCFSRKWGIADTKHQWKICNGWYKIEFVNAAYVNCKWDHDHNEQTRKHSVEAMHILQVSHVWSPNTSCKTLFISGVLLTYWNICCRINWWLQEFTKPTCPFQLQITVKEKH